ncbi:condensin-2 complex subunit D3 isoform X1 [Phascolarctos cinereus]|uniref:Condensin-2 complex subunit D3 n=1 Tax=Phascolarctos cinereus TaxID=38626 RepID=A0A6P5IZN6_PHACI|nr:condensin-2 complex subunit D3 isoform X1 [Phascolarctos cinereus]
MALRPNLESCFGRWCPPGLSLVWVDTVWELDFMETEPLDPNIEVQITEDGLYAFTELYENLFPFAAQERGTTESIWTIFKENNISHNALVALFYHFVEIVHKKNATVQNREYGLHAAGLYFLLLEIPGSIANQVFHPVMFDKCLQILKKSWPQESNLSRKRKKEHPKSSQADSRGNRKRGKPPRKEDGEMDEILEEEDDEDDISFSVRDICQIRDAIFLLMKNFLRLLPKFPLKEKPQCVQNCIQILVGLTSFEPVLHGFQTLEARNIDKAKYIPELAYHGLHLLCSSIHGEGDKVITCLFHRLLNVILMFEAGEGSHRAPLNITSQTVTSRNHAIQFISSLVDELKEVVFPVLRILLQHICSKVLDKSEYRTYAAHALARLLSKLPCLEYAAFIRWLYRYSRSAKISHRVFTLDVVLALLEYPERELDSSLSLEEQKFLKHKFLVQELMFGRCSDKAPTVRSKALSSFVHCLEMSTTVISDNILEILQASSHAASQVDSCPTTLPGSTEGPSNCPRKTLSTFKTINVTDTDSGGERIGIDGNDILTMLRQRIGDEKTNVRKSALQVLVSIMKHSQIPCTQEDLSTLQDRCRDPAVSVRKQALQSLTDLLMAQRRSVLIQKAWLTGIIPVVMDTESTVQEKALECLDQLVLQHIKHYTKFQSEDGNQMLAWDLLTLLTSESQELSRYLNKAFHMWSKREKFSSTFINNVISHCETEHSAPAWMLLSKVACSSPKLDYTKIIESWERISGQQNTSSVTTGHILCVIGHISKHLPRSTQEELTDVIKCKLREFQWPPEVISSAVDVLQKLCHAFVETTEEEQELQNQVCVDILSACENYISKVVLKEGGTVNMEEDLLVRHIFTLGEVAQLCPSKVGKRVFLLIQSILASVDEEQLPSSQDNGNLPPSQPLSQFRGSVMPPLIRAHAVITLGKLCLQHEDLAKKCIAALVRELEVCEEVAVRNNVIIVLCDLCIRYTVMVDRYIPNISVCLKDSDPFIRKQTLILLTNLLQEEFVKWKGSLFFRFVSSLVDQHPEISSFGEFCLVHLLLKRNPGMFFQHFIECIFHFNSYEKHEKYNKFPQSEREKQLFSLKGKNNKEKRMWIYKFLLEHFTDEQRFNITSKINLNILACFVDGVLPLDMEANELLSDTFEVLSSKEIKLLAMRSKSDKDLQIEDDELAMANVVMQEAQKKLISQVQKRNFIENVIPIITSLKSMLEQNKIPALRDLMNYLREVMQDYRDEIKDFFAADKQLASELEYDMKKYEEQLAKERELEEQRNAERMAEISGTLALAEQSPLSLGTSPPPVGHDNPGGSQATSSGLPGGPVPTSSPTSETGSLKLLTFKTRRMSLSTLAILNSVKKAVESKKDQRSQSFGGLSFPSQSGNTGSSKQGTPSSWDKKSFCSLNQHSVKATICATDRAISTPDQTINDVTFGAGVSYITPSSAKEKSGFQDQGDDILCLSLPDKAPQPRQWNVKSPARSKDNLDASRRKSLRKTPLKTAN